MKNRTSLRGWKVSAKSGWILLLCLGLAACGGSFTGGAPGTSGTPELRCAP